MKKLVMVFALSAMLGSCGGGAAGIDVTSIDSPCGCAEAVVKVMGEQIEMVKEIIALGKDASEEDIQKVVDEGAPLRDKEKELTKHCRGDLSFRKANKDECDAMDKLEELKDEMKNLEREARKM